LVAGVARELIDRCTRGDACAWREFVARYRPAILRVLVRAAASKDPSVLCDLEQDVWTRVVARDGEVLRRLRGKDEASVRAFLGTVALNVARDARRRAAARPDAGRSDSSALEGLLDDPEGDPELRAADRERQEQALEAARAEVQDERDLLIFQLHYRGGASAAEIAAVPGVGLTAKGVETVLYRLTQRVRRRLGTDA
jgi:RNA polymerase sigma-70 factor (ECF subfamily)